MKKDEIIELLKEQIKGLRDDNNRLLDQIDALIKEVSSLKEALLQKGESLGKQQRLTKGIAKLVSNTSEQQQPPQPALPEEERQKREAEKADKRKARKNNGAKRDMHYEMEQEEHDVYSLELNPSLPAEKNGTAKAFFPKAHGNGHKMRNPRCFHAPEHPSEAAYRKKPRIRQCRLPEICS